MEEIKGTEALEREILDDAARKAEKIIRKAKEEAQRLAQASVGAIEAKRREMEGQKLGKIARMEKETLSKLPLEKTRLKTRFIDNALRVSARKFLDSLGEEALGAWCFAELGTRLRLLSGRSLVLSHRKIDAGSVREIGVLLGTFLSAPAFEDPAMSRPGLVIKSQDGTMIMTLTEGQLEERLLDEYRGELASVLVPVAAAQEGTR